MEKGNNPTRAAAVGCVRGADSIRSRGVLTRMSCVCSPAGPQAGALLRSHECFLRNPKQPHDTVPCCLLRKGFEKGSWAAGICAWLCCSSHSQGISTVVFLLLFFCCLLAFVLVLKHNELTKVPESVTWPYLMSMCDLIQITHLYLNHIGNQQSVGLFTGYLKVSCPS